MKNRTNEPSSTTINCRLSDYLQLIDATDRIVREDKGCPDTTSIPLQFGLRLRPILLKNCPAAIRSLSAAGRMELPLEVESSFWANSDRLKTYRLKQIITTIRFTVFA